LNEIDRSDLILEIARCRTFKEYDTDRNEAGSCGEVLAFQKDCDFTDRHLPIPWQGHIEKARVVFISSNPSKLVQADKTTGKEYDSGLCPSGSWWEKEQEIVDFFQNRFENRDNTQSAWAKNNHYRIIEKDGGVRFSRRSVPYWNEVRGRANEIYELDKKEIDFYPGQYYVITEIVHCQSNRKEGVCEALETCAGRFLNRIMKQAICSKVIVLMDSDVSRYFNQPPFNMNLEPRLDRDYIDTAKNNHALSNLGIMDKSKYILVLPAAGTKYPRKLKNSLTKNEITELSDYLNEH
jgi:hypothetical protein